METLQLSAWHESGHVVYTYLARYSVDGIQLSAMDSAGGTSKFNAGPDLPVLQLVMTGKGKDIPTASISKAITIAKNLIKIYAAGTCSELFFSNGNSKPLEIEIEGKDLRYLNTIQDFLLENLPGHSADYLAEVVHQLFADFQKTEFSKPILKLSKALLAAENYSLNRFYIEDALMSGGINTRQNNSLSGLSMHTNTTAPDLPIIEEPKKLDSALLAFIQKLRPDLGKEESEISIRYLKEVFAKLG